MFWTLSRAVKNGFRFCAVFLSPCCQYFRTNWPTISRTDCTIKSHLRLHGNGIDTIRQLLESRRKLTSLSSGGKFKRKISFNCLCFLYGFRCDYQKDPGLDRWRWVFLSLLSPEIFCGYTHCCYRPSASKRCSLLAPPSPPRCRRQCLVSYFLSFW